MSLANSSLSMSVQGCHRRTLKLHVLALGIDWLYLITYAPCTIMLQQNLQLQMFSPMLKLDYQFAEMYTNKNPAAV